MMKSIEAGLLESLKPSIKEKIHKLLKDAFEMALLINDKKILEDTIDSLSGSYADMFAEGATENDDPLEGTPEYSKTSDGVDPRKKVGIGVSLVTGKYLHTKSKRPGGLIKADSYSPIGVPMSRYKGVSYSGSLNLPWVARYSEVRLGSYKTEEEAAKEYDKERIRNGKHPLNFS